MKADQSVAPVWHEEHLRLAVKAACVALWSWHVDDDRFEMDERAFELWGLPWAGHVTFEQLSAHIHPADRDRVRAAFAATRSVAGSYEIDFRILLGEEVRWISARGQGADAGIVDHVMFGIFLDVTGRKQAEEGSELLAGEMSHRVKNLLAIATGLTQLTGRSAKTVEGMTGERTATALAMIIHELATNSVKYGSLSAESGFLDVSSTMDGDDICITWAETGGPPVTEVPVLKGYGSRLTDRSVQGQLGGQLDYDWQESGLVVTVRMRHDHLAR